MSGMSHFFVQRSSCAGSDLETVVHKFLTRYEGDHDQAAKNESLSKVAFLAFRFLIFSSRRREER